MKRYRAVSLGAILAVIGLIATGCGGISGSHSISPASFFLPGILHHEPAETRPDDAAPVPNTGPVPVVADKPLPG